MTTRLRTVLLWLCCWLPGGVVLAAPAPVQPWMLADWSNPAPPIATLGLSPAALGEAIGARLVILPHPERDIALPGADGLRHFPRARFLSAVARVDLPAATLRRRLQDFSAYRHLFPLMPESELVALDGRNRLARYRLEIPLPALATFTVDFRIKHRLEPDGSISLMLVDGRAESLIAMLGGMTDELAEQPVVARWEALPLTAQQSLLVFTYWDRLELKSFFARKLMEAYPELKVAGPYLSAFMAVEPLRRTFTAALPAAAPTRPAGAAALETLRGLLERMSAFGHVAVVEPEAVAASPGAVAPLRYVTLANRINVPPAAARHWSTRYARLPEVIKELKDIDIKERGPQVELGLDIRFAVLVIRFSLDLELRNTWISPQRLEFVRSGGQLARLRGAAEWHGLAGRDDSLMLTSVAHEVGENAPLVLRLAHRLSTHLPYVDQAGSLIVQLVVMERLKPWIEQQARAGAPAP